VPILGAGDLPERAFQETRELREPFEGTLRTAASNAGSAGSRENCPHCNDGRFWPI
jgi:hypothetical protein